MRMTEGIIAGFISGIIVSFLMSRYIEFLNIKKEINSFFSYDNIKIRIEFNVPIYHHYSIKQNDKKELIYDLNTPYIQHIVRSGFYVYSEEKYLSYIQFPQNSEELKLVSIYKLLNETIIRVLMKLGQYKYLENMLIFREKLKTLMQQLNREASKKSKSWERNDIEHEKFELIRNRYKEKYDSLFDEFNNKNSYGFLFNIIPTFITSYFYSKGELYLLVLVIIFHIISFSYLMTMF